MKFNKLLDLIKKAILFKRKKKTIKEEIMRLAEEGELQKSSGKELSTQDKRRKLKAVYKRVLSGTPYASNIETFQKLIDQVPDDYIDYELQINLDNALNVVDELIQGSGDFTGGELKNIMNVVSGVGVPAIEKYATGIKKLSKETGTFGAKAINKNTGELLTSLKQRRDPTKALPSRTLGKEPVIVSKELTNTIKSKLAKVLAGPVIPQGEFSRIASRIKSKGINIDRVAKSLANITAGSKDYEEAKKKAEAKLNLDFTKSDDLFKTFFNTAKKQREKAHAKIPRK